MLGHLLIIMTLLLLAPLLVGLGGWITAAFKLRLDRLEMVFLAFWLGFGICIAAAQMWHFAAPINAALRGVLILAGVGGLLFHARDLLRLARRVVPYWWFVVLVALFTVWIANRAIGEPVIYETGLYHINVVQWSVAYPVVPGLGNLHSRLGFSNAYFLFAAVLEAGPWTERVYHIPNTLLFWVLVIQAAVSAWIVFRRRKIDLYHSFQAMFLPVLWLLLLSETILPSMANDPPVFALGVVIAGQMLNLIQSPEMRSREVFFRLFFIVFLTGVGTAIKFSFLIFGALLALLGYYLWIRRYAGWKPRTLVLSTLFLNGAALVVLVPMMARSVMMTGYPLYPLTFAPFPVDWRIYPEHADLEYAFIQTFARVRGYHPYMVTPEWNWLPLWIEAQFRPELFRDHFYLSFPFFVTVGALIVLLGDTGRRWWWRRHGQSVPAERNVNVWLRWFLIPSVVAVGFWFTSAPAPRFAGAAIWALAFTLLLMTLHRIGFGERRWHWYASVMVFVVVAALPFVLGRADRWVYPVNTDGLDTMPKPFIKTYTSESGLTVFYPTENNQCWDTPLPCTPYPHPNMRYRVPGDLSQGFLLQIEDGDVKQVVE
ncbi:MAG: hypothetical protein OHK0046_15310 [Anaerolineae bacterium]